MSEFEGFLKNFDTAFQKAEATGFDTLPDGKYQASIDRIYIAPNKSGELALRMELNIVNHADYAGRKVFYYKTINQDFIGYVKADLQKIGIEPEPFSKVETYFAGVLDEVIEITLKTGKPAANGQVYQNLYIQKRVGELPASPALPEKPAAKKSKTVHKNVSAPAPAVGESAAFDDLPF
jgi:hypothetical protein